MTVELQRHRFTVEEYHRMGEAGVFSEDDRVELIEGEIVEMTPIGSRHQACVDRLTELFSGQVAGQAVIRVQGPIRLSCEPLDCGDGYAAWPADSHYRRPLSTPHPGARRLLW